MWIATRAANKRNWPGMLDSTAGGGLSPEESVFEGMCREALEEASLPLELSRSRMRGAGMISILNLTKDGLISRDVDYVYDLPLPADVVPKPSDGEVERFDLFTVEELIEALFAGRFMPGACIARGPH